MRKTKGTFKTSNLYAVLLVLLLTSLSSFASAGSYPLAVIDAPKAPNLVHLRKGTGTSTTSLGQFYSGTVVVVNERTNSDWWHVEIGNQKGYMQASFLKPCGDQGLPDQHIIESAYHAEKHAVVNNPDPADRLHLRDKPATDASSYGRYYNGTQVTILGVVANFSYVLVEGDNRGYMLTKYLKEGQPATQPQSTSGTPDAFLGYAVVSNAKVEEKLHLRANAKSGATSLGQYENGTTVAVVQASGDWYLVNTWDQTGYMHKDYLLLDSELQTLVPLDTGIMIGESGMNGTFPLRTFPSSNAPLSYIPFQPYQTTVQILGKAGTFYHIAVDGQEGFIPTQWVVAGNSQQAGIANAYAVIKSPNVRDRLHLRKAAQRESTSLGQYFNGTQVQLLNGNELTHSQFAYSNPKGWAHVRIGNKEGYMLLEFLIPIMGGNTATWK